MREDIEDDLGVFLYKFVKFMFCTAGFLVPFVIGLVTAAAMIFFDQGDIIALSCICAGVVIGTALAVFISKLF